jgi:hypothetical protein
MIVLSSSVGENLKVLPISTNLTLKSYVPTANEEQQARSNGFANWIKHSISITTSIHHPSGEAGLDNINISLPDSYGKRQLERFLSRSSKNQLSRLPSNNFVFIK